jgi:hypothetical protein
VSDMARPFLGGVSKMKQVRNQVRYKVTESGQESDHGLTSMYKVRDQVRNQVRDQVWDQVEDQVCGQV